MIVHLFNQALNTIFPRAWKLCFKPIFGYMSKVRFEKVKVSTDAMRMMQMPMAQRVKLRWHCTFANDHFLSNMAAANLYGVVPITY